MSSGSVSPSASSTVRFSPSYDATSIRLASAGISVNARNEKFPPRATLDDVERLCDPVYGDAPRVDERLEVELPANDRLTIRLTE